MGCVAFHLQKVVEVVEEEQEAVERKTLSLPVGTVRDLGTTLEPSASHKKCTALKCAERRTWFGTQLSSLHSPKASKALCVIFLFSVTTHNTTLY